jgi:hypothetical protein
MIIEDSNMQCEYITPGGQCSNDAIDGMRFCVRHGGQKSSQIMIDQYRISSKLLGDAPARHAAADEIKSLRGEIALVKSLLEARLNMIENQAELVAAMPQLKDFALAVEKLATACHNMDVKLGTLLDKQALMSLAQDIIQIIDRAIRPLVGKTPSTEQIDEVVEAVGTGIVEAIATKENQRG